jgi:O-antigen/teichoic acid export membrane protein
MIRHQASESLRYNTDPDLRIAPRPSFLEKVLCRFPHDRLTANAFFLWASSLVGSLTGFLFWTVAAKFFSDAEVGLATAVISLALLLAAIAVLGIGQGTMRFFYKEEDKSAFLNAILGATFFSSLGFGVICIAAIRIVSPTLAVLQQALPAGVFLFLLVATTQNIVIQMVFISLRRSGYTLGIMTLLNVMRVLLLLIVRSTSAQGIVFSLAAATFLSNTLAVLSLRRLVPAFRPAVRGSISRLVKIFPFSLANGSADLLNRIPALVGPLVIIAVLGNDVNAHYYIAWVIGSALVSPGLSFAQSAFAETASDPDRFQTVIRRSVVRSLAITIGFAAIVGAVSGWILSFFGTGYLESLGFLRWLCWAAPLTALNSIFITIFRIQNRLWVLNLLNTAVVLVFLGPLILFRGWSLTDAGGLWVLSQLLVSVAAAVLFLRRTDIPSSVLLKTTPEGLG